MLSLWYKEDSKTRTLSGKKNRDKLDDRTKLEALQGNKSKETEIYKKKLNNDQQDRNKQWSGK